MVGDWEWWEPVGGSWPPKAAALVLPVAGEPRVLYIDTHTHIHIHTTIDMADRHVCGTCSRHGHGPPQHALLIGGKSPQSRPPFCLFVRPARARARARAQPRSPFSFFLQQRVGARRLTKRQTQQVKRESVPSVPSVPASAFASTSASASASPSRRAPIAAAAASTILSRPTSP
jgi:hypothetical protein